MLDRSGVVDILHSHVLCGGTGQRAVRRDRLEHKAVGGNQGEWQRSTAPSDRRSSEIVRSAQIVYQEGLLMVSGGSVGGEGDEAAIGEGWKYDRRTAGICNSRCRNGGSDSSSGTSNTRASSGGCCC